MLLCVDQILKQYLDVCGKLSDAVRHRSQLEGNGNSICKCKLSIIRDIIHFYCSLGN